jgi:hypothetical protein
MMPLERHSSESIQNLVSLQFVKSEVKVQKDFAFQEGRVSLRRVLADICRYLQILADICRYLHADVAFLHAEATFLGVATTIGPFFPS